MAGIPEEARGDLQGCCHIVLVLNGRAPFFIQDRPALHYLFLIKQNFKEKMHILIKN